jgi:hypothetical protein
MPTVNNGGHFTSGLGLRARRGSSKACATYVVSGLFLSSPIATVFSFEAQIVG